MSATQTADTERKQSKPWQFKKGQSGNPAGRPKGSRSKLGEAFIAALHDDFQEHGADAIQKARTTDPLGYVKVCASLLPKELKVTRTDEIPDDELDARIRELAGEFAELLGIEIRADAPPAREEATRNGEALHS